MQKLQNKFLIQDLNVDLYFYLILQCEKLKKKRTSLVGAFVSTHGKSIDDVDRSIVEARTSLNEVTQELQERVFRWKQIELLCGFNIINNNGLQFLEGVCYRNNGRPGLRGNCYCFILSLNLSKKITNNGQLIVNTIVRTNNEFLDVILYY